MRPSRPSPIAVYLRAPLAMKVALEVMQELAEERTRRPRRHDVPPTRVVNPTRKR